MRLTTDRDGMLVGIDGLILEGWLEDATCPTCGEHQVYAVAYDATFCPACNVWLELRCPEPGCIHCRCRPARPRSVPGAAQGVTAGAGASAAGGAPAPSRPG